jgi:hypothetical protein
LQLKSKCVKVELQGKKMAEKTYEQIRDDVIQKYKILYKDALAMDLCEVPKELRLRLLDDPVYISKTKAIKANLFVQQLETLDAVLAGTYSNSEKPTDTSGTILKALEMKQKLLLEDLNVTKDESNALNVTYIAMSKEDFEALDTVEINEGGNSDELGADFGGAEEDNSFEAKMKAMTKEKLKEKEKKESGTNS